MKLFTFYPLIGDGISYDYTGSLTHDEKEFINKLNSKEWTFITAFKNKIFTDKMFIVVVSILSDVIDIKHIYNHKNDVFIAFFVNLKLNRKQKKLIIKLLKNGKYLNF